MNNITNLLNNVTLINKLNFFSRICKEAYIGVTLRKYEFGSESHYVMYTFSLGSLGYINSKSLLFSENLTNEVLFLHERGYLFENLHAMQRCLMKLDMMLVYNDKLEKRALFLENYLNKNMLIALNNDFIKFAKKYSGQSITLLDAFIQKGGDQQKNINKFGMRSVFKN